MSRVRKPGRDQLFVMSDDELLHELNIVGGPRPSLWIGEFGENGPVYIASFSGNAALRKFRDALTAALREATP